MMAQAAEPRVRRNWYLCMFEISLILKKALVSEEGSRWKCCRLQKAVIENNLSEVCALLEGEKQWQLNTMRLFVVDTCRISVPLLCVAISLQNGPMVRCLLKHGANANKLGWVSMILPSQDSTISFSTSPLKMALEDHPSRGLPFDPDIATALLEAGADINSTKGNQIHEEEEEGGSLTFHSPSTVLLRCLHVYLPHSPTVFRFLLDHRADLFVRNSQDSLTPLQSALHWLVQHPDDANCQACVRELIVRDGFLPSLPTTFTTTPEYQQERREEGSPSREKMIPPPATEEEEELEEHHDAHNKSFNSKSLEGLKNEFSILVEGLKEAVEAGEERGKSVLKRAAHLLFDAGYKCSETDVASMNEWDVRATDACLANKAQGLYVYSLKQLCRRAVRQKVGDWSQLDRLSPFLPQSQIDYLMFRQ